MKTSTLDRAFTLILLAIGLYVTVTAFGYGLYRDNVPGPGFFPVIAGIVITVLAAALLLRDVSGRKRMTGTIAPSVIGAVVGLTAMIVAFVYAAPYVGMAIAAFVMMLIVGYLSEEDGKRGKAFALKLVFACLATVIVCNLLFGKLINVPLLEGPLGF